MDVIKNNQVGGFPGVDDSAVMAFQAALDSPKDVTLYMDGATYYGFVVSGEWNYRGFPLQQGGYFAIKGGPEVSLNGVGRLIVFLSFSDGMTVLGEAIETSGRLQYIDGCTDSLLIAPLKFGEPCLNVLYFPKDTNQSFHTHPSLRFGCVASGSGVACIGNVLLPLEVGDAFHLPAGELHRFKTTDTEMVIIAYHPDSQYGPKDEDHPMIISTQVQPLIARAI